LASWRHSGVTFAGALPPGAQSVGGHGNGYQDQQRCVLVGTAGSAVPLSDPAAMIITGMLARVAIR
jgi:hypothetical protein